MNATGVVASPGKACDWGSTGLQQAQKVRCQDRSEVRAQDSHLPAGASK